MQSLPTFRFNIWLDNYEEYNCSTLGDVDWASRGTSRPYWGAFCIAFGIATIPAYFVCALTMVSMRQLSVYKIMLFLAAADITNIFFASFVYGIMSITGEVFCAHPRLQLVYSLFVEFFFFCSTTACALLALNRFGEMLLLSPIVWLFQGSRTWIVLGLSTIPVALLVLFTPPMLFNSTFHMLFFDPMIFQGRYSASLKSLSHGSDCFQYDSFVHFACVTFMPVFSLIMYLAMFMGLICKHGKISKGTDMLSRATFQIIVQSGVIIVIHLTSLMAFQILQFLPASAIDTMLYFAHLGWMLVHGTPSIVYLSVNQTIRVKLLTLLGRQPRSTVVSALSRSR